MLEEETYEEVSKEKREVAPDPVEAASESSPTPAAEGEADAEMKPADGEAAEAMAGDAEAGAKSPPAADGEEAAKPASPKPAEKKAPEKKFEWVEVKKTKKRTKRTDLKVSATGRPGLSSEMLQKLMDAESAMQAEMREIKETDAKRNDLEAYLLNMRSKIEAGAEYGPFITPADRETFGSELTKAEDWLYDTFDGTKTMYIDKLDELKLTGDAIAWRQKESSMRGEWITAIQGTIFNYRSVAEKPGDKFDHIEPEKLATIIAACGECEKWLEETKAKQDQLAKHEKPVLLCAEIERRSQELAKNSDEILKAPKPAPPKEEKAEAEEKKADEGAKDADMEEPKVDKESEKEPVEEAKADLDVD